MEVLKSNDLPVLRRIVQELFLERSKGKEFLLFEDEGLWHYSKKSTGEFIIYEIKTEGTGIYIIEVSEIKNGNGCKCHVRVYQADLANRAAYEFSREHFENSDCLKAKSCAAKFAHSIKNSEDIGETIWGPLFSRGWRKNQEYKM